MSNVKDVSQVKSFQMSMKDAVYDKQFGTMHMKLDETEIGGIKTSLLHVFIDPNTRIQAHLHEHGGEIIQVFSPIIVYLGHPIKFKDGKYQMEGDKISVVWNKPIQMNPGDSVRIAESTAHSFFNPNNTEPAHIQFVLPNSHFEPDNKGNLDRIFTISPEV